MKLQMRMILLVRKPWAEPAEAQRSKAAGLRQTQPTVLCQKAIFLGIFSNRQNLPG